MDLIIGGAYQGKRAFAENTLGVPGEDVYTCTGSDIDFSKPCIDRLEEFTLVKLHYPTLHLEHLSLYHGDQAPYCEQHHLYLLPYRL